MKPKLIRECGRKVLKLSSDVSDVLTKVLKLSFEVSECKPLLYGLQRGVGAVVGLLAGVRQGHHKLVRHSAQPVPIL